jgi:hypothetical protein
MDQLKEELEPLKDDVNEENRCDDVFLTEAPNQGSVPPQQLQKNNQSKSNAQIKKMLKSITSADQIGSVSQNRELVFSNCEV